VVRKPAGPGETELFIFDPFHPNVNIARSSFRWWQVRQRERERERARERTGYEPFALHAGYVIKSPFCIF